MGSVTKQTDIKPNTIDIDNDSYMKNAYFDKKFNSYQNGPGAALIDDRGNQNRLLLCIKRVPSYLDEKSLNRILSNYGNVNYVSGSKSDNCSYYFAECATENDFEAILKGMQTNDFRMKVEPKTIKRIENSIDQQNIDQDIKLNSTDKREIDMSKRTIKGPFNNRQHPKLGKENKNSDNQNKEYSFNYKNLYRPTRKHDKDYEKDSRINIIKNKAKSSEGKYDSNKGEYTNFCKNISLSQIKLYPCRICNNPSIKSCERCKEYYCSVECHSRETHLLHCSKVPLHNNNLTESSKIPIPIVNKLMKVEFPKLGQTVVMTHVEQTDMVYIRSNEQTENDDYIRIINTVAKYSDNAKFLIKLPDINEYVVANYNGIWYRAIILNNENPDQILIAYIDIGSCEKKKLTELKELVPECYNLKCYTFVIYLNNLKNCVPNDYYTNYMNEIVDSDVQLKIIFNRNELKDNINIAELYIFDTNENINNKCIELLTPSTPNDSDKPVMWEDIPKEELPVGENISLTIVSHSWIEYGNFSCISSSEIQELDDLNDEVKKYAESTNHYYTPRQDEMCIAKSDNEDWYRAYCIEVVGDGFPSLLFIDYGNVSPVSIENIRKYPKAFTLPCKTYECSISDLKCDMETTNNQALTRRLRELLPLYGTIVVPKVEFVNNDDSYVLHLPHIIDMLEQEGLLEN